MTREETIELKAAVGRLMYSDNKDIRDYNALIDFIESALRPVSREQVEKVCGKWIIPTVIGGRAFNIPHCSVCNGVPCGTDENTKFCAHCGAPMTDEAVQMVMERINKLEGMKNELDLVREKRIGSHWS